MTSLVVTGADGFVGRNLCGLAVQRGFNVRGVTRHSSRQIEGVETVSVGEIGQATDWSHALVNVDTVIHLAARVHVMHDVATDPFSEFRFCNVAGTERLARCAVESGVKRLVYISSIKVNGEETRGDRYSDQSSPNPKDAYGISKWEAEQELHRISVETGLEIVVVRPPLVYGPGVKGNFIQMLNVLARGVPLPLAACNNCRSLLYVGNLVDALITCATHPAAAGQTYLVSDGEDVSTSDLLRRLGAEIGHPARLFFCPPSLLRLAGKITGKSDQVQRLLSSLQVDSGKIRRELNWIPPFSMQQGLQATAEWYRNTHP